MRRTARATLSATLGQGKNSLAWTSLSSFSRHFSAFGGAKPELRPIYLDAQSTTPVDPRVTDKMLPLQMDGFGNPHSRTHSYGWESEAAVEVARKQVAELINANPKEIIFTSGATECNNMAIKGAAHFYGVDYQAIRSLGKPSEESTDAWAAMGTKKLKRHIITTETEHKCVLNSCRELETEGFDVTYLPVQKNGLIDLGQLKAAIRDDTLLVSVMYVNNEIGVIQPVDEIGQICVDNKIFFHTDAAQALGKVPIDVKRSNIALMSLSSHKVYGPKGMGALYVRRKPRTRLIPLITGGGQERAFRSGTLPTPLVVGFGEACAIAKEELPFDTARTKALYDRLYNGITERVPEVVLNGCPDRRYYGNMNLSFSFVEGESLLMALKNIALSSGSACTSASLEPSYVLRALGVEDDMAHTSIRFGIGRFTTEEEIDYTIEKVAFHVERLRNMSPLWEMAQEGIDIKSIQWSQDAH